MSILRQKQALTDITVAPFYAQLDRVFPGSKFILTTRPLDTWLRSVQNHFRTLQYDRDDFMDFIHACVYGALYFNADRFAYVKDLHEANVQQFFQDRPEQLLVFDVFNDDGWEKLCVYLERPVPDATFPHENVANMSPVLPRPRNRPTLWRRRLRQKASRRREQQT